MTAWQKTTNSPPGSLVNRTPTFAFSLDRVTSPFFVDLGVFDRLGLAEGPNTDGINVMSLVLEVPIDELAADGVRPNGDETSPSSVLGVYARNLRRVVEIRNRFGPSRHFGRFVQVSRLAIPLINDVVLSARERTLHQLSAPHEDVATFGAFCSTRKTRARPTARSKTTAHRPESARCCHPTVGG